MFFLWHNRLAEFDNDFPSACCSLLPTLLDILYTCIDRFLVCIQPRHCAKTHCQCCCAYHQCALPTDDATPCGIASSDAARCSVPDDARRDFCCRDCCNAESSMLLIARCCAARSAPTQRQHAWQPALKLPRSCGAHCSRVHLISGQVQGPDAAGECRLRLRQAHAAYAPERLLQVRRPQRQGA